MHLSRVSKTNYSHPSIISPWRSTPPDVHRSGPRGHRHIVDLRPVGQVLHHTETNDQRRAGCCSSPLEGLNDYVGYHCWYCLLGIYIIKRGVAKQSVIPFILQGHREVVHPWYSQGRRQIRKVKHGRAHTVPQAKI